jgi:hypothetical protein
MRIANWMWIVCVVAMLVVPAVGRANVVDYGGPDWMESYTEYSEGLYPRLDTGAIRNAAVLDVSEDSIDVFVATTGRCRFEVRYHADGSYEVLRGSGGRCDFDQWLTENVHWVEPSGVVLLWEQTELLEYMMMWYGSGAGDGDMNDPPVDDLRDRVEPEAMSDCQLAWSIAIAAYAACGATGAVTIFSTGPTMGASFLAGTALTWTLCAGAALQTEAARRQCANHPTFSLDDLQALSDSMLLFVDVEEMMNYVETHDVIDDYVFVEQLYDPVGELR